MLGQYHPFSGALYERDADGNVLVHLDGRSGLFAPDGRWLEGELFEADPQMCNWIAGPKVRHHRLQAAE
jgi:hypothetical protein